LDKYKGKRETKRGMAFRLSGGHVYFLYGADSDDD